MRKEERELSSGFPSVLGSYPLLRFNHILLSILLVNSHYPLTEQTGLSSLANKYRSCDPYNNLSLISMCQNFGARYGTY